MFSLTAIRYRFAVSVLIAATAGNVPAKAVSVHCSVAAQLPKYCDCDLESSEDAARYDAYLCLDAQARDLSNSRHNPWGVPLNPASSERETLLIQEHYVINHDGDLRVPTWVAYRLTANDLSHSLGRSECFRRDVRLSPNDGAVCGDYDEPLGEQPRYDRGHLVPSADMVRSKAAMINTYMFSNMAPQHDKFNRIHGGIWEHLEQRVRGWAKAKGAIYVIAGTIFDRDDDGLRDEDINASFVPMKSGDARVAIPTHFFKIVLHLQSNGTIDSLAFVLEHVDERTPQERRDKLLEDSLTSIGRIESYTGVTFLPHLAKNQPERAKRLKRKQATSLWPTN